MKDVLFSVCIPNYNYAHYIGQTIQSVLDQTYQNFEILVADNASTDNSVAVVEAFRDPRIRLIRNQYNIGFAPNLQRVSMYARGDFINLLSSDDLMKPHALETYAQIIRAQPDRADCLVFGADADIIDGEGKVTGLFYRPEGSLNIRTSMKPTKPGPSGNYETHSGRDVLRATLSELRVFAPFLTVTYSRALWEAVEGYNSIRAIAPDKHFNYKLLAQNPEVVYVREPLYQYRMHGSTNWDTIFSTLKRPNDDYMYTLEFSDDFLASLELSRRTLIRAMLEGTCLKYGLQQILHGRYSNAFKMFAFCFASYPWEALRRPKTYALGGLLLTGPLARLIAPPALQLYRRLRRNGTPNPAGEML